MDEIVIRFVFRRHIEMTIPTARATKSEIDCIVRSHLHDKKPERKPKERSLFILFLMVEVTINSDEQ